MFRSLWLVGLLFLFLTMPAKADLTDKFREVMGYTIVDSSSIIKKYKDLDDDEIKIRLANGMMFQVDADEDQIEDDDVVVLQRKFKGVMLHSLVIGEEILSAFRIK